MFSAISLQSYTCRLFFSLSVKVLRKSRHLYNFWNRIQTVKTSNTNNIIWGRCFEFYKKLRGVLLHWKWLYQEMLSRFLPQPRQVRDYWNANILFSSSTVSFRDLTRWQKYSKDICIIIFQTKNKNQTFKIVTRHFY